MKLKYHNYLWSAETTSKSLRKIYDIWDFKITGEAGLKQTDFLNIELNLNTKTYFPFKTINSRILCKQPIKPSPTNLKTITYNNQRKTKQTIEQRIILYSH